MYSATELIHKLTHLKFPIKRTFSCDTFRLIWYSLFITSMVLVLSQYLFCSNAYNLMEGFAVLLMTINGYYTFSISIYKHKILSYYNDKDDPLVVHSDYFYDLKRPLIMLIIEVVTIATTAGKTPNCRNPYIRLLYRSITALLTVMTTLIQDANIRDKRKIFDFILTNEKGSFSDLGCDAVVIEDNLNRSDKSFYSSLSSLRDRFDCSRPLLERIRPSIVWMLHLDVFVLTVFYLLLKFDTTTEFQRSFSLTFTMIVMLIINMSSSVFNMVEFNKSLRNCELLSGQRTHLEVGILGWKPEGDLLIGYMLGLVYVGINTLKEVLLKDSTQ